MAKFRLRHLLERIPGFDGWRLATLASICHHGSNWYDQSYQISKLIPDVTRTYIEGHQAALFAVYHGHCVGMLQMAQKREQISILISESRDGEIITRALLEMGFSINRGSSQRGAVKGGMQVVKSAQSGHHQVLMVDGPRGPRFEVKPGIIRVAEITGLPIIPFVCSARHYQEQSGWDRFLTPDWGTSLLYSYGVPMFVPKEASPEVLEECRQKLDAALARLRTLTDDFMHSVA